MSDTLFIIDDDDSNCRPITAIFRAEVMEVLVFGHEASVELRRPVQQTVPSALALLGSHPWPGNVRELRAAPVLLDLERFAV